MFAAGVFGNEFDHLTALRGTEHEDEIDNDQCKKVPKFESTNSSPISQPFRRIWQRPLAYRFLAGYLTAALLMHKVDEELNIIDRGFGNDAVTQVKNMAGATINLIEQPLGLGSYRRLVSA